MLLLTGLSTVMPARVTQGPGMSDHAQLGGGLSRAEVRSMTTNVGADYQQD